MKFWISDPGVVGSSTTNLNRIVQRMHCCPSFIDLCNYFVQQSKFTYLYLYCDVLVFFCIYMGVCEVGISLLFTAAFIDFATMHFGPFLFYRLIDIVECNEWGGCCLK